MQHSFVPSLQAHPSPRHPDSPLQILRVYGEGGGGGTNKKSENYGAEILDAITRGPQNTVR